MQRICTLATLVWLATVNVSHAQTNPTPGMGFTSPLGTSPSEALSSSPNEIPLGAIELNPNGLSPLVIPCPSTDQNAPFDGGGATASAVCDAATSATSSGASAAATSGSGAGVTTPSTNGSGIPLGSTELTTAGESPNIAGSNTAIIPCPPATFSPQETTAMANPVASSTATGC